MGLLGMSLWQHGYTHVVPGHGSHGMSLDIPSGFPFYETATMVYGSQVVVNESHTNMNLPRQHNEVSKEVEGRRKFRRWLICPS